MVCEGCTYNYWMFIKDFHLDDKAALRFLRLHGVLPLEVQCQDCKLPCTYREDRHSWYCGRWTKIPKTKKRRQCSFTTSDYKGTFLERAHVKPSELVCFVNHWLQKKWDHDTVLQCLKWTLSTCVHWARVCSVVTEWWLHNQDSVGSDGIEARSLFLSRFKERRVHQFFIEAGRLYRPQSDRQPSLAAAIHLQADEDAQ